MERFDPTRWTELFIARLSKNTTRKYICREVEYHLTRYFFFFFFYLGGLGLSYMFPTFDSMFFKTSMAHPS